MELRTLVLDDVLLLGAFHGLNPGMGWLFAVALGMQERRPSRGVAGDDAADAGPRSRYRRGGAGCRGRRGGRPGPLVEIPRGDHSDRARRIPAGSPPASAAGGMRVGMRRLTAWSFLMATSHGAGLMVIPIVLGMAAPGQAAEICHVGGRGVEVSAWTGLIATAVHTAGYLGMTAAAAWLVFEKLGLGLLRKAWFNVDLIWAAALLATGAFTLAM